MLRCTITTELVKHDSLLNSLVLQHTHTYTLTHVQHTYMQHIHAAHTCNTHMQHTYTCNTYTYTLTHTHTLTCTYIHVHTCTTHPHRCSTYSCTHTYTHTCATYTHATHTLTHVQHIHIYKCATHTHTLTCATHIQHTHTYATHITRCYIHDCDWQCLCVVGLGALSAAVMSSMDSSILGSSTMFTHNIYNNIIRKQVNANHRKLTVSREIQFHSRLEYDVHTQHLQQHHQNTGKRRSS